MSTLVIRIVPPSLTSNPSPEATEVVPLAVPPSIKLISAAVDVTVVPFIDNASVSNVPSMSAFPLISNVAASNSPVIVRFLWPVVSMFASVVTTLEAIAVPAVNPSSNSNSASARTALPAVNPVPVTIPVDVTAPTPNVPARVAFAPAKVNAVVGVEPDLMTNSPD